MNHLIQEYTQYNMWANERTVEMLQKLTEAQLEEEIVSSFPSIKRTLLHIWDAEAIWLNRLQGESLLMWPSDQFMGTKEELFEGLLANSCNLTEYTGQQSDSYFEEDCAYKNTKGQPFKEQRGFMIHHCMNHSSFHRGQIITMLRQLGQTELMGTDFILYVRKQLV